MGKLLKFRRLKHGDPRKFKVLAEDIRREQGSDDLSWTAFAILVADASVLIFIVIVLSGGYPLSFIRLL